MNDVILQTVGATFGIAGTLLLALKGRRAGWGFVAFLVSNAAWILFALLYSHWGLLAQQACFTVTSAIGAYVWLFKAGAASVDQSTPAIKNKGVAFRDWETHALYRSATPMGHFDAGWQRCLAMQETANADQARKP